MKYQYLVEITERLLTFVSVEAVSPEDAIEAALTNKDNSEQPYPPETEQITAKIIREDNGS